MHDIYRENMRNKKPAQLGIDCLKTGDGAAGIFPAISTGSLKLWPLGGLEKILDQREAARWAIENIGPMKARG